MPVNNNNANANANNNPNIAVLDENVDYALLTFSICKMIFYIHGNDDSVPKQLNKIKVWVTYIISQFFQLFQRLLMIFIYVLTLIDNTTGEGEDSSGLHSYYHMNKILALIDMGIVMLPRGLLFVLEFNHVIDTHNALLIIMSTYGQYFVESVILSWNFLVIILCNKNPGTREKAAMLFNGILLVYLIMIKKAYKISSDVGLRRLKTIFVSSFVGMLLLIFPYLYIRTIWIPILEDIFVFINTINLILAYLFSVYCFTQIYRY